MQDGLSELNSTFLTWEESHFKIMLLHNEDWAQNFLKTQLKCMCNTVSSLMCLVRQFSSV